MFVANSCFKTNLGIGKLTVYWEIKLFAEGHSAFLFSVFSKNCQIAKGASVMLSTLADWNVNKWGNKWIIKKAKVLLWYHAFIVYFLKNSMQHLYKKLCKLYNFKHVFAHTRYVFVLFPFVFFLIL